MPRTARAAVGGVCYHVLNRANDRKTVFHAPTDFARFLKLVEDAGERHLVDVLAYCLMPNHFHLVLRPKEDGSLGRWMHWLMTSYVLWYRLHYESVGHIWQGRFKAFPIQDDAHLLAVLRYVERNAQRAGLVSRAEDWPWGSLRERTCAPRRRLVAESAYRLPPNWREIVNTPESEERLGVLRACVTNGRPFGAEVWIKETASRLGLESTLRSAGRPRRDAANDTVCATREPRMDLDARGDGDSRSS
jgi:putative transposase